MDTNDALMTMAAERMAEMREEREQLRSALRDIALGADIMLSAAITPSLINYANEVKRVAKAALGDKSAALRAPQESGL